MRSRYNDNLNMLLFPGRKQLKCDQVQRYSLTTSGSWYNPISLDDGPAIITGLWVAVNEGTSTRLINMTLEFDGGPSAGGVRIGHEPTGGGTSDLINGEIFGGGFDEPILFRGPIVGVTNAYKSTESPPVSSYYGFSGYTRMLMPYYDSFKFYIKAPSANRLAWVMVERVPITASLMKQIGLKWGMYLRTYGDGLSETEVRQLSAGYVNVNLLDEDGPLGLAGFWAFFNNGWSAGGNNFAFLEGDMKMYYDNELSPSYRSSGLEDFFYSSWYFLEIENTNLPFGGIFDNNAQGQIIVPFKNNTTYTLACGRYWFPHYMPWANGHLKLEWQNGEPSMPDPSRTYIRWLTWYYK